jgi:hypothetical protein
VALRLKVHQRRLGKADEGARGWVHDDETDQQPGKPRRHGGDHQAGGERESTDDHDQAPAPAVCEQTERRLNGGGDQARQRQKEADLDVTEPKISPYERPSRFTDAEDNLVQNLDGEEQGEKVDRPVKAPGPGSAGHQVKFSD